ncbi:MAG: hypothetical protein ABDH18_02470 [Aquificaceae bacterium]
MEKCFEFFQDSRFVNCLNDFLKSFCGLKGEQFLRARELSADEIPKDSFGVLVLYSNDRVVGVSSLGFINSDLSPCGFAQDSIDLLEKARFEYKDLKLIMLEIIDPSKSLLSPAVIRDLIIQAHILMCGSLPNLNERL